MNKSYLTNQAYRLVRYFVERSVQELPEEELGRSAVVFAPHPDDETLGCGGTLIRKRKAQARVDMVFVTDGARSHDKVVSAELLRTIRKNEAISAGRVLGIEENRIMFLNFPDGQLYLRAVEAEIQVEEILQRLKPEQVFIPCFHENISDHLAVNRIVLAALENCGLCPVVYEYPVWFWNHWPWVSQSARLGCGTFRRIRVSLSANYQMNLLRRFRSSIFVGDVLDIKRRALEEYRSQMTRLIPDVPWPTLSDVGEGEFLECFFQQWELFYCYRMTPSQGEA
ncbi:MAG: PIG-L family deacetylase [Phycisphaerae bacterium]|jgi:LmbE family N-acetylglucosaminyl deacetylase|nr:PIG-L family deacetylase [Phycisphaerae bacterium]